ncbi:MAG: hypothetical protein ACRBCK_09640 [Alphaproteobacteria bacterium]
MKLGEYNRRLLRDKGIHYVVVMFTVMLVVLSLCICIWALYGSVGQAGGNAPVIDEGSELPAKPLPDYIVDKVEPNELEQLKP